jgi:hypothetical protein
MLNRFGRPSFRALSLCGSLLLITCAEAAAAQFQWYNDPNSDIDFSGVTNVVARNTDTRGNILPFNLTNQVLPDVGRFVPFIWPRGADGSAFAMTWGNTKSRF